jgi:hypothetical protein
VKGVCGPLTESLNSRLMILGIITANSMLDLKQGNHIKYPGVISTLLMGEMRLTGMTSMSLAKLAELDSSLAFQDLRLFLSFHCSQTCTYVCLFGMTHYLLVGTHLSHKQIFLLRESFTAHC